jgi:phospholipid/cholesterol/gamma-HCH transport system substrate-binding protein
MSKSRLEWKVGLFVFIGLVLLGALAIEFSKGLTLLKPTYDIYLRAPNVGGGLKVKASVLMSGVQVGTVSDIRLAPDGRSVVIVLRIFKPYVIHSDARFAIEQSGFLGDQYVSIIPTENRKPPFQNGAIAEAEAPFNLQEFTRIATGFITRIDETVKNLNDALKDVTRILLNPQTLTNLSVTAANLRTASERALGAIDGINAAIATNGPSLTISASNLVFFTQQLNDFATELRSVVDTNSDGITRTVKNVESSSESLKALMSDLQAGKGLAGNLLKDQQLANKASEIANNLSITTSNLNRLGLWKMLWQHKPPKTSEAAKTSEPASRPLESPKAGADSP